MQYHLRSFTVLLFIFSIFFIISSATGEEQPNVDSDRPWTYYVRRSETRGRNENNQTSIYAFNYEKHKFSEFKDLSPVRVFNEHILAPGQGYPRHQHVDFEIMNYIVDGTLTTTFSRKINQPEEQMTLQKGDFQYIKSNAGFYHSEYNNEEQLSCHYIQFWIFPPVSSMSISPLYRNDAIVETYRIEDAAKRNHITPILLGKSSSSSKSASSTSMMENFAIDDRGERVTESANLISTSNFNTIKAINIIRHKEDDNVVGQSSRDVMIGIGEVERENEVKYQLRVDRRFMIFVIPISNNSKIENKEERTLNVKVEDWFDIDLNGGDSLLISENSNININNNTNNVNNETLKKNDDKQFEVTLIMKGVSERSVEFILSDVEIGPNVVDHVEIAMKRKRDREAARKMAEMKTDLQTTNNT